MVGLTRQGSLYGAVCSDQNLTEAWHRVLTHSADSPGVDGITVAKFQRYLFQELRALQRALERGVYEPLPIKRLTIAKRSGGRRPIGILAVRDRVAQVAVLNVIEPLFEPHFADGSFGYRPSRSASMALDHAARLVHAGIHWTVRFDIKDCFESIDCVLLQRILARTVKDRWVRRLIRKWLEIGGRPVVRGRFIRRRAVCGLVQGSPLSPFLSNVYLDRFDKQMAKMGIHAVRYADDVLLLARSQREARRALKKAQRVLRRLRLTTNAAKTRIAHVEEGVMFLGATLVVQDTAGGRVSWVPSCPAVSGAPEAVGARGQGAGADESERRRVGGVRWEPSM